MKETAVCVDNGLHAGILVRLWVISTNNEIEIFTSTGHFSNAGVLFK